MVRRWKLERQLSLLDRDYLFFSLFISLFYNTCAFPTHIELADEQRDAQERVDSRLVSIVREFKRISITNVISKQQKDLILPASPPHTRFHRLLIIVFTSGLCFNVHLVIRLT